jgi:hypothetical protein
MNLSPRGKARAGASRPARILTILTAVLALAAAAAGCEGPRRGLIGGFRGRSQVLDELETDAAEAEALSGRAAAAVGSGAEPRIEAFPLLHVEDGPDRWSTEVLWPLFEAGRAGEQRYFRLRPFFADDAIGSGSRAIVFPFYFRIRRKLEAGDREIDHFWPFYGVHREWIDLAPSTTHHVLYPIFSLRRGPDRWRACVFPILSASKGYLDRGIWLLPLVKAGSRGQSRFFYLVDPLFAYEKDSIARSPEEDTPELTRTRWSLLGGLLAWEVERGRASLRLLWLLRVP